ncbi:globin domain-containing protein [Pontibacillus halophilus]|uniref:globin domain-containing protein n=1 Tax=Pontibacillus halophilus TaxID=516704 RepID=UPI000409491F|nr:globin domain-containing protein [Pontibacillus halophilus]
MISKKNQTIVYETVPVLEEKGVAITTAFYKQLFSNHPELWNVFNHRNQEEGKQQKALAHALLLAAKHIQHLDQLTPVVQQIAHKHRSVEVKREHYPVVGYYLLQAMREVLELPEDHPVLLAWKEYYYALADVFITAEQQLYKEAAEQSGGWEGERAFTVTSIVEENATMKSLYLSPADGKEIPLFEPGQYVTLYHRIPEEPYTHIRHYSLSNAYQPGVYRITVRKEGEGTTRGKVSHYLHNHITLGDQLSLTAPAGTFTLNRGDKNPVVLLAGGSGITPLISMMNTIANETPKRSVKLLTVNRSKFDHPFMEELEQLTEKMEDTHVQYIPSGSAAEVNRDDIQQLIIEQIRMCAENTEYYISGPETFVTDLMHVLEKQGVSAESIKTEVFNPTV